jgi:hypothetical protein
MWCGEIGWQTFIWVSGCVVMLIVFCSFSGVFLYLFVCSLMVTMHI